MTDRERHDLPPWDYTLHEMRMPKRPHKGVAVAAFILCGPVAFFLLLWLAHR